MVKALKHAKNLRHLSLAMSRQKHKIHIRWPIPAPYAFTIALDDHGALSVQPPTIDDTCQLPREKKQFLLEPFASLHGVGEVSVTGLVEEVFAAKLAAVMMSTTPIELPRIEYATETVIRKRKVRQFKRRKAIVPVRQCWEPTIDWDAVLPCRECSDVTT